MIVVDSSVLFEIITDGPLRASCLRAIGPREIAVSSIAIFEIYRKVKGRISEDEALSVAALLRSYTVLEVTPELALEAADLSLEHRLGMADSMMLAHAKAHQTTLLTLDNDFTDLPWAVVVRG